ncbi:MAG: hypothetical protein AAGA54_09985 [Myxococcota bacterium]
MSVLGRLRYLSLVLPLACAEPGDAVEDDTDAPSSADVTTGSDDAGDNNETGEVVEDAQYLAVGILRMPEGRSGYGTVLNTLGSDAVIDLSQSGVFPGLGSLGAADDPDGEFFVGVAESPLIQRYATNDDGTVTKTGELSVLPFGSISGAGFMSIVDESKGYLFSYLSQSIIVFDPSEMVLVEELPVDFNLPAGYNPFFSNVALRDGNRIVMATLGVRSDAVVYPKTRAVILDTDTNEITYAEQEGCGGLTWAVKDADGNLHFGPLLRIAASILTDTAGEDPTKSCIVSMRAGASAFDDGLTDLLQLAGRPVGSLVPGPGNLAYVMAMSEDAPEVTPESAPLLNLSENWTYNAIDLTNPVELTPVAGFEDVSGYPISYSVLEAGNDAPTPFLVRVSGDFAESTIFDVSDPANPVERYTAPGSAVAVFRLR